ncbi:MAG: ABC transporter ATP-binding protein [Phycisphaerae bacterium]|nr:ABC transporter ATP-binding protein [Phycisphaerae bacterium]NUQ47033.1 ABC transporter ATP-binding protein [Phycisphaerae bacterium]
MSGSNDNHVLVEVRDLWKIYRTGEVEVPAVRGIDLTVRRGEFVAVMGPSGSGKSTFMHLVGCLDRPDRGVYYLDGKSVADMSRGELARLRNQRIGFVFQSFNLLSRTTVVDNVALPLTYQHVGRRLRRRRATALLDGMGLGNRLHHLSNQLSGGQQQRVAIARALITGPALLLADEPTGNLDSRTGIEIMGLLQALNRRSGLTILLVTHEPDIAAYTNRHVIFRDGKIVGDELNRNVHEAEADPAYKLEVLPYGAG